MPLFNLRANVENEFVAAPEVDMAIQVGQKDDGEYVLVVGGQIAAILDQEAIEQLETAMGLEWMVQGNSRKQHEEGFRLWRKSLKGSPPITVVTPEVGRAISGFLARGMGVVPPPPAFTAPPHGHLPFTLRTSPEDVFYRWEPYPRSRRINQASNTVLPGTYGAPYSETQFIPTGFSAVSRFALPSLFPARWRWEIQPTAGTVIRCGASVPMYGQSGGGVEVMFPNGCQCRGPIANPVVIPMI
jgi:hypothetical protein